jgi:hypothetical protein
MYHFNWGWGGNYNGYFALSNLNPGGNNLTSNQHAIIGIKPNDGSTLVVNTTWSGNITNTTNIAVPDAISLTVSPGAIVKFGKDCKLQIWGKINSVGTSTNYAKFTAINTSDGWDGFEWYEDYLNRMSDNDSSKLIYTQVEYSKSSGIYCSDYGKILIDHSKINNNYGYNGGGISIFYSPINIIWSEIYNNNATSQGGGIFLTSTDTTSAIISQNNLHDNIAGIQGAGFFLSCYENVVFEKNIIDNNQAVKGAGGMLSGLSPLLINNKFCNNYASSSGGGLYLENCNAKIINNLVANNSSGTTTTGAGGGFAISTNSNPNIINNSVVNNSSHKGGGMIFAINSNANIKNCIIYGNYGISYGNQIGINTSDSDPFFDHCNIQGGLTGFGGPGSGSNYTTGNYTNNIDANPLFVNPSAGAGNGYNGLIADWTLQFTPVISPCINTGDTTGVSNLLPTLDLGGNPRINGIIDMGAYEYSLSIPVQLAILNDTVMYGQFACYSATQTITVAGGGNLFKVSTGGSAELIAGQKISYLTGTMVEEGGYMLGYISPVGPWCKAQVLPLATTISNEEDGLSMPAVSTGILVFPNPTTGEFTLSLIGYKTTSVAKVSIYGLSGEKILESSMEYGTSRVFSLAGRASGVYYFRVKTGNETIKGKIVKL